jgi:hypothetical protein
MAFTDADRLFIEETIRDETEPLRKQMDTFWKTIKGGNGDGLLTEFRLAQQSLKALEISVRSLVERTDVNKNRLQSCQLENIPKVNHAIDVSERIEKLVGAFIDESKAQRKEDKELAKEREQSYGSWAWFRDKRVEPMWIAVAIYLGVEAVKYFFIIP